jgi:hypothetical protein
MGQLKKTALGQVLNIDQMRLSNEYTVAVGNMNVNARGDEVFPSGEISKSRNEIMKDHYKPIGKVTKYNANKRQGN